MGEKSRQESGTTRLSWMMMGLLVLLFSTQMVRAGAVLEKIRRAPHDNYYRIVFDFSEKIPIRVNQRLDQGYVDLVFQGRITVRAPKRLRVNREHIREISLYRQSEKATIYRISGIEVDEVRTFTMEEARMSFVVDLYADGFRKLDSEGHILAESADSPSPETPDLESLLPSKRGKETKPTTPPEPKVTADTPAPPPEVTTQSPKRKKQKRSSPPPQRPRYSPTTLKFLELAAFFDQIGEYDLARDAIRQGLSLSPDEDTLTWRLGVLYLKESMTDSARQVLNPLRHKRSWRNAVLEILTPARQRELVDNSVADSLYRMEEYYLDLLQQLKTASQPRPVLPDTVYVTARLGWLAHFIWFVSGLLTALLAMGGVLLYRKRTHLYRHLEKVNEGTAEPEVPDSAPRPKAPEPPSRPQPGPPATEGNPQDNNALENTPPPAEPNPPLSDNELAPTRDQEVYKLADKEKGIVEIAETLGLTQDEVALILELRDRNHNNANAL